MLTVIYFNMLTQTSHSFTCVLPPDAGQDVVFQKVAFPLVTDFLHGKNGISLLLS